jgi:hypothetical protein
METGCAAENAQIAEKSAIRSGRRTVAFLVVRARDHWPDSIAAFI